MQTYMATHEYPTNITTKGSQTKHDESSQQVHYTVDSASHQVGIIKASKKQDPTSNIKHQTQICATQCIVKEVREHTTYTSHLGTI